MVKSPAPRCMPGDTRSRDPPHNRLRERPASPVPPRSTSPAGQRARDARGRRRPRRRRRGRRSAQDGTDIYAAISADGGRTFGAPGPRQRHRRATPAPTASSRRASSCKGSRSMSLWVSKRAGVSGIRAASSTDGGTTFGRPAPSRRRGVTGARGWESAAIGPTAAWCTRCGWMAANDASGRAPGAREHHQRGRRATGHLSRGVDGAAARRPRRRSRRTCASAARPRVVSRGDEVFVAWRHLFPGGVRDIAVARSSDGGKTFSAPVRVSEDNWKIDACPDDGPAMTLDARGASTSPGRRW